MKTQNEKNWIPINEFLEETHVTRREIYSRVGDRQWHDGYVIKKTPTGRYVKGCIEDYNDWLGI